MTLSKGKPCEVISDFVMVHQAGLAGRFNIEFSTSNDSLRIVRNVGRAVNGMSKVENNGHPLMACLAANCRFLTSLNNKLPG